MNNLERFKAETGRFEYKMAKKGRVDGGGRKAFPATGSQGVRGVKVDISRQKAIIPAKVFLKFPTRFSPFIGLIHTIFAIFRRKVRPPTDADAIPSA